MGKKWSYEEVKEFIEVTSNSGCELVTQKEDYVNGSTDLKLECKCGEPFNAKFTKFKDRGKRQCNECGRKQAGDKRRGVPIKKRDIIEENARKQYIEIRDYINGKEGNGCKLLTTEDEYKDTKTKLSIQCPVCGEPYETDWFTYIYKSNKMCNSCSKKVGGKKRRKTIEEMRNFIEVESDSGCKLISDSCEGVNDLLELECACGRPFKKSFHKFKDDFQRRCKTCSRKESSGERKIKKFLQKLNIKFISEFIFDDCKYKSYLPFDFAIFKNNKVFCLIEYDGIQHFEPKTFGGISQEQAEENFKQQKLKDNIKNEYCKINKIKLIRIPYWDFKNIEKILEEQLRNLFI